MNEEKINILPVIGNGGGSGTDTATAMAMMNNNPWMYLVMLALFSNGAFGNNRGAGLNGVLDMETQNKLNSLQAQINDNNNNAWAREAIQGNTAAISQLSQSLGINYNFLRDAISSVNTAITNLGAQNGMGFAGVTRAIDLGNLNLIQQLKDCCCGLKTQILEQGYQNQLQTINQTNDLQTTMRVESGLVRTEVAAFRQAWENARYQDVVAEKTRLQTELDLVRSDQAAAARIAPLQRQIDGLQAMFANFMSTYGNAGRSATQTTGATGQ